MHGFDADHTGQQLFTDTHRFTAERWQTDTAHSIKFQITVVRNVCHHQAHFVHVGTEHHAVIRAFFALLEHDQIAERVHSRIDVCGKFGKNIVTHSVLPTGCAAQRTELFNAFDHACPSPSTYSANSCAVASTSRRSQTSTLVCMLRIGIDSSPVLRPHFENA